MKTGLVRAAVVAAGTLVLATLAPLPDAVAAGSCGSGTPFVGATVGAFVASTSGDQNWHQTTLLGPSTITVYTDAEYEWTVYDETCGTALCGPADSFFESSCTVPAAQTVNIGLRHFYGGPIYDAYAITAVPSSVSPTPPCGPTACVSVTNGAPVASVPVPVGITTGPAHNVVGTLDIYTFALPGGGTANVPCVVLTVDTTTANPCQSAGGTFFGTVATLVNTTVNEPLGPPVVAVGVCHATVTVLVASIGVQDFPAYSIC